MKRVIFVVLAVVIAAVGAAPAYSLGRPVLPGEVGVEVVSDRGTVYQAIPHEDFWTVSTHVRKWYLEARKGDVYGIIITNLTPERVGVVIAVDGRNILTGKRSDLGNNESMYIVNAYEVARYDGWRTSQDEVHRFYFTDVENSYSVRTFADTSAMGLIAMAVFREKEQPRPLLEKREGQAAPAAPPAAQAPNRADRALAKESAGTGFGEARYSPVVAVQFEPERNPFQKTLIKYEWREVLCRKGILPCNKEQGNRLWDEDRYAPSPPEYPKN